MASWESREVTNAHLLPYIHPTDPDVSPSVAAGLRTLPFDRNIFALLANAPAFFPTFMKLLDCCWSEGRNIRASEWQLAVLRTAILLNAPYIWDVNQPVAKILGFNDGKLEKIRKGDFDGADFTERQKVVARMANELAADDQVSEGGIMEAKKLLGDEGTMEVLTIQGIYGLLARTMRSCKIDFDPEIPRLEDMLRTAMAGVVERERRDEEEDRKRGEVQAQF